MSTALIVILIVLAIIAGTVLTLKTTARKGMPPPDVLKRANDRARDLAAREQQGKD